MIQAVRYEGGWRKKERITSAAIFSSRWVFPFQKLYLYSPAPPPFPVLITPVLESTIPLKVADMVASQHPWGLSVPEPIQPRGDLAPHTTTHPHPPCWVWSHLSCWLTWDSSEPGDTSCNPRGCRQGWSYQLQQAKEDQPVALLSREERDTHHPVTDTEVSFITKLHELKMLLGPKVKHWIFVRS